MQTKRKIRIGVFRGLGSNRFRIYIYKYTVPGAASNHVVIFKAEQSASLNHPKVQQCCSDAEALVIFLDVKLLIRLPVSVWLQATIDAWPMLSYA